MAVTLKNLFTGQVGSSASVLYTAGSATTARVDSASVVNTSGSDVTLKLWVPQGGSAGSSNMVLNTLTIPAATTSNGGRVDLPALRGRVIAPGGTIVAQAGTAGVLTVAIDGLEIS